MAAPRTSAEVQQAAAGEQPPVVERPASRDIEKQNSAHQEEVFDKPENQQQGDYSGAIAKSSPEEIKLVRKLDLFLMPTLWIMVRARVKLTSALKAWLTSIVLPQLPRQSSHHPRPSQRPRGRPQPQGLAVQHRRLHPLCGLHARPDSQQHDHDPCVSVLVDGVFHDRLGRRQRLDCFGQRLCWSCSDAFFPWYCRGAFLPWRFVPSVDFLYPQGVGYTYQCALLW